MSKINENLYNIFTKSIDTNNIKNVANKLNISTGTIKRWLELKNIPIQYTFDIYKLLSININYDEYSFELKDQFFTPKDIAKKCWDIFLEKVKVNLENYTFIEPSAGDGVFLDYLPSNSIALDIEPRAPNIIKQDYLLWEPNDKTKKYIVFGNPPFGLRGHLALNFINHSFNFADYVCFILPQLFDSDGKGSPMKRIIGYSLIHSEKISTVFFNPKKEKIKVNCIFQIWSKYSKNNDRIKKLDNKDSKQNIKIYSLSNGGTISSNRNINMINKCDIYLPSTCFGKNNMKPYDSFNELPNKRGYGIVFNSNKENMIKKTKNIDWTKVSFLSTNSALNLRTSIILQTILSSNV